MTWSQFWNAKYGDYWPSINQFLNTPIIETKERIRALNFYLSSSDFTKYKGLYLGRYLPYENEDKIFSYRDRPLGAEPIIMMGENFDKVVVLHEFLHHLISEQFIPIQGQSISETNPRIKVLSEYVRLSEQVHKILISPNFNEDSFNEVIDIYLQIEGEKFKMTQSKINEELGINQFLLLHHSYLNLSHKDVELLRRRYISDVDIAKQELNLYDFENILKENKLVLTSPQGEEHTKIRQKHDQLIHNYQQNTQAFLRAINLSSEL